MLLILDLIIQKKNKKRLRLPLQRRAPVHHHHNWWFRLSHNSVNILESVRSRFAHNLG
jgi:hypothetical protein